MPLSDMLAGIGVGIGLGVAEGDGVPVGPMGVAEAAVGANAVRVAFTIASTCS